MNLIEVWRVEMRKRLSTQENRHKVIIVARRSTPRWQPPTSGLSQCVQRGRRILFATLASTGRST